MLTIDAHLHFDNRISDDIFIVAKNLNEDLKNANIDLATVLHLDIQPWDLEEVSSAISENDRLIGFANIHPFDKNSQESLRDATENMGFKGLKLHPRIQKYEISDQRVSNLISFAGEINVPVLIDAFPDGDWLSMGFDVIQFMELAKKSPKTKIIFAHFGGHHCIDFMMMAKRLPNVYFDCSYSLLYYRGSSITQNIIYCMQSMGFERVFYGSDYPDRSIQNSLDLSLYEFKKFGVSDGDLKKIMGGNFAKLLGLNDE
jgi:predicted TIM-barrel fold metal-dependent hydrolase